jgi:hypothetical protein
MVRKIMIVLMINFSGMHAMMCVQTKDMPVLLPKVLVEASPVLQEIEKDPALKKIRLRGLFQDQPVWAVVRVIEDQKKLTLKGTAAAEIVVSYRGFEYCIACARRLGLAPLLAEYGRQIRALVP